MAASTIRGCSGAVVRLYHQERHRRRPRQGRFDDHPAGRQISAADASYNVGRKIREAILAFRTGIDADQAADPRALPQLDLPRPERLWRAGGRARLFRQGRRRADPARSGLSRRPSEGAGQLRSGARDPARRSIGATMCCARWTATATSPQAQWRGASAAAARHDPLWQHEKFRQQGGYFMEEVRRELIKTVRRGPRRRPEQPLCRRPVGAHLDGPGHAGCRRAGAARRAGQVRRRPRLARPRASASTCRSDWAASSTARRSGTGYPDWRKAVVLSKSGGQATIGFTDGSTGTLPASAASMPKRGVGGAAFDSLRPGHGDHRQGDGAGDLRPTLGPRSLRRNGRRRSADRPCARHAGRVRRASDRATTARPRRFASPGSAFKPIVYIDRARQRHDPSVDHRRRAVLRLAGRGPGQQMLPSTSIGGYAGPQTMRWGVEQSRNLMTVRTASQTGMPKVIDTRKEARRWRLSAIICRSRSAPATPRSRGWSTPYAILANQGRSVKPTTDRLCPGPQRQGDLPFRQSLRAMEDCNAAEWDGKAMPRPPARTAPAA